MERGFRTTIARDEDLNETVLVRVEWGYRADEAPRAFIGENIKIQYINDSFESE